MNLIKTLVPAAAMMLASFGDALAHSYTAGELHIEHPWARATPPAAKVGGAYLTIQNHGDSADRLVGGSSPIAERVEIHTMEVVDGIMKMHELENGLEIPAGGEAKLAPGSYHMMMIGLSEPLKDGERVPLTLTFEKAGSVDVELAVEALGAKAPSGEMGGHDHDMGDAGAM
ncbi:copper chaperone PCu(A)C [Consotaella aegiceratis]|uniref:copper chaperone PCu(A)C n=1 Tax=Consotaella aegiceratis TaxID=3097961 RepID=UPI002F3E89D7